MWQPHDLPAVPPPQAAAGLPHGSGHRGTGLTRQDAAPVLLPSRFSLRWCRARSPRPHRCGCSPLPTRQP